MIKIGVGNVKGGVGSTLLCFQLAALIQRNGHSVAIAETTPIGSDLHWCRGRSLREGRPLNGSLESVGYFYLDDYSDLRRAGDVSGYDYLLLDYSNVRKNIEEALRHVQHWLCPFAPHEYDTAINLHATWQAMLFRGSGAANTFSAVINQVPNALDIATDPAAGRPMHQGDLALEAIRRDAPDLKILQRRILHNIALEDSFAGRDVFAQSGEDASQARDDIAAVWMQLLQEWHCRPKATPALDGSGGAFSLARFRRYMVDAPPPRD